MSMLFLHLLTQIVQLRKDIKISVNVNTFLSNKKIYKVESAISSNNIICTSFNLGG